MNYQLLSADIVRRVHHSPDSDLNLAQVVANLIRAEHHRAAMLEHSERLEAMRNSDQRRESDFATASSMMQIG